MAFKEGNFVDARRLNNRRELNINARRLSNRLNVADVARFQPLAQRHHCLKIKSKDLPNALWLLEGKHKC